VGRDLLPGPLGGVVATARTRTPCARWIGSRGPARVAGSLTLSAPTQARRPVLQVWALPLLTCGYSPACPPFPHV
jgi:hypothetical protein